MIPSPCRAHTASARGDAAATDEVFVGIARAAVEEAWRYAEEHGRDLASEVLIKRRDYRDR